MDAKKSRFVLEKDNVTGIVEKVAGETFIVGIELLDRFGLNATKLKEGLVSVKINETIPFESVPIKPTSNLMSVFLRFNITGTFEVSILFGDDLFSGAPFIVHISPGSFSSSSSSSVLFYSILTINQQNKRSM